MNRQVLMVRGNDGTDHECFLPLNDDRSDSASSPMMASDNSSHLKQMQKKIERLKSTCLQLQGGYWAYEVCPMRHVRQFHREFKKTSLAAKIVDASNAGLHIQDSQHGMLPNAFGDILQSVLGRAEQEVISEDYLLGRYVPEATSDRLVDGLFVQTYIDGDRCAEAEGISRQADVRYECSLAKSIDHIIDVTEISSCRYSVRVGTAKVCSSNATLPDTKRSIKCYPIVSHKQKTAVAPTVEETELTKVSLKKPLITDHTEKREQENQDRLFWRQRLRHFLTHDRDEYPIIHKIINEFMESEHMAMPDSEEDIPDRLVKKWLMLLGIDEHSAKSHSEKYSSQGDDRESDKKTKSASKEDNLFFKLEL